MTGIGSVLHAVGDEAAPFCEIAGLWAAASTSDEVRDPDDAPGHLGFLANLVGLDSPPSGAPIQELLGREPHGPSLLDDLEQENY